MGRLNATFLLLAVTALVILGLVMLTSTSVWMEAADDKYEMVQKQALWIIMGVFAAICAAKFDYRKLRKFWVPLLVGSSALLVFCYLPGFGLELNGASRWVNFPGLPVFQPSELAKIFVVMGLAGWYSHFQTETQSFYKGFVFPGFLMGVPVLLIFFQTDMGTAAALGGACFIVMFVAGSRLHYLGASSGTALSGAAFVVWQNPERMGRVMALFDLESDKYRYGDGLQQLRGLYAFANGGVDGAGLGNSIEKLGYLPYSHADFIFPVIGEELGLWFTLGIVFCFVIIAVYGIGIAINAKDTFGRLFAIGLTGIIVVPAMMNIGVCTAVLPNTGLPLPLISHGGTNMFATLLAVGLLISIHRQTLFVSRGEMPVINEKKQCLRI